MLRNFRPLLKAAAAAAEARTTATAAAAAAVALPSRRFGSSPAAAAADAFDADNGFVRGIFSGKIHESQVFPYPDVLVEDEKENLAMTVDMTTKFFDEVNDPAKNEALGAVEPATFEALKELGAFGLQVPEEYGGPGFSNTGYARLVEVVGRSTDLGVGITLGAHQSIGFKGIMLHGTPEQKEKYLPRLATGELIAAFALTEPSSGSDANSIRTRAKLSGDGKHWVLNGQKLWISGGGLAEIFTVFAQTEVPDEKKGGTRDAVTAFIVERGFGGVTNGKPENKMGITCSNTTEVFFEDVKVPRENELGKVGDGFKVAMSILNSGRFGMCAALTGTMKAAMEIAAAHANERVQFGHKLKSYGLVQEKLAQMALKIYAAESIAYTLSANMDRGSRDYQLEAAIGKVFASEAAWHVTDEAIQVLGGNGFMRAVPLERILRDLRIFRIFEGANEVLRLFIALTGIQTAGQNLKQLQKALSAPLANTELLGEQLPKRALAFFGMGKDTLSQVHPNLKDSASKLEVGVSVMGQTVEALLIAHNKGIINRQMELKRLADVAIDLYAMACVLSRASRALNEGAASAAHEELLCRTWCEDADSRVRFNLKKLKSKTTDGALADIAKQIFENDGKPLQAHPLRV